MPVYNSSAAILSDCYPIVRHLHVYVRLSLKQTLVMLETGNRRERRTGLAGDVIYPLPIGVNRIVGNLGFHIIFEPLLVVRDRTSIKSTVARCTRSPAQPKSPARLGLRCRVPPPSRACSTSSVSPAAVVASAVPLAISSANFTRCATVQVVDSITPRMPR